MSLKVVLFTLENGLATCVTAKESRNGQMELNMTVSGRTIKQKAKVDSYTLTETFSMVNGKKTRPMVTVSTFIKTVPSTKATGRTISNMAKALRPELMAPNMTASTSWAKSTERAAIVGLTVQAFLANGIIIKLVVKACISGWMEDNTMEIGLTTICMVKASTLGKMAVSMKASICSIENTATVFINGPTKEDTKANGKKESNTVMVNIFPKLKINKIQDTTPHLNSLLNLVSGSKAKE